MEQKSTDFDACEIKFAPSEGSFSGYGSVFGNLDSKGDVIMAGAYADVIKSGDPVAVYVNHGWIRGDLPVGSWAGLKEDSRGLFGDASLVMQMRSASDAYYAMKSKLVTGLSIAFMPDEKSTERKSDGTRVIHRIKRLKEISIVNDPANTLAEVTNIKAQADLAAMEHEVADIKSVRDFELFLRDAGGLSKGVAVALVARAKAILGVAGEPDTKSEANELTELALRLALRNRLQ